MKEYIEIIGNDLATYKLCRLTKDVARANSQELLLIHNIIPYVHWETDDLLADISPKGLSYDNKWQLSFIVYDKSKIVGLLIAYIRSSTDAHPINSIYIHRLAISSDHQGKGVGRQLLLNAIKYYAGRFSSISTYTVQTNDEEANDRVIKFYETVGFQRFMPVRYPEKLDILLRLESDEAIKIQ
jgi:ribosomal protein S18 acetylase RimI-like enzyme